MIRFCLTHYTLFALYLLIMISFNTKIRYFQGKMWYLWQKLHYSCRTNDDLMNKVLCYDWIQ